MKLVELHVQSSGQPIAINPEAISQIGVSELNAGYIVRIDGGHAATSRFPNPTRNCFRSSPMFPDRRCRAYFREHLCNYCLQRAVYDVEGAMFCRRCYNLAEFTIREIVKEMVKDGDLVLEEALFDDEN